MRKFLVLLSLYFVAGTSVLLAQTADTIVRISTNLGDIDVQLDSTNAPKTVANFLAYADNGLYNGSFIHRSVPGFIIQGGGYEYVDGQIANVPQGSPVMNEYKRSNLRGTIAMAKLGGDPNSATNQWFFNLADTNSTNLDNQNGGFTVFGEVVNAGGLAVIDAIAALRIFQGNSPFDALPVMNYTTGSQVTSDNLVIVNSVTHLPTHPGFFNGETSLANTTYYLSFSNGNYFGYYSYLNDVHYIYHFDLGFEYVFDANDGHKGAYFYDFKSGTFFYSSPTFPFPYLYDFKENSVVYYYGDPSNAGHYNTNGTRFFYVFNTQQIITK